MDFGVFCSATVGPRPWEESEPERIRRVTGIMNLCAPINHPVRVAEQIAMIDIHTNGRIELGTGRGSGSTEVNGFGLRNEQTRGYWEEAIRAILRNVDPGSLFARGRAFLGP